MCKLLAKLICYNVIYEERERRPVSLEGLILTSLRGYGQAVAVEQEGRMLKRRSLMANSHNSKTLRTKKASISKVIHLTP